MGSLSGITGALVQGSLASVAAVVPHPQLPSAVLESLDALYRAGSADSGPAQQAMSHLIGR